MKKYIKSYSNFITETISYHDIIKKQEVGEFNDSNLFSNENSEFIEDEIHIDELREINELDEEEQTVSFFEEVGMQQEYEISKSLLDKLLKGIKLTPIIVDENYKMLDGRHRLAAYSEMWLNGLNYHFDGLLKVYKRVKN